MYTKIRKNTLYVVVVGACGSVVVKATMLQAGRQQV
jgi:hypothetical protein